MNDIAKKSTADRFLKAVEAEHLSKAAGGALIGLAPAQVSYLFNESYWNRLGNVYWDKVLHWVNSGVSLKTYGEKHHVEVDPSEITEVEFEEVVHSPVNKQDNLAIQIFLKQNSNLIITKNRNYYFMPFWFSLTDEGKIELFSLGSLPEDLKDAIKLMRGE